VNIIAIIVQIAFCKGRDLLKLVSIFNVLVIWCIIVYMFLKEVAFLDGQL